ncbi:NAD(P)/FAD-dependent oxidoreductase [Catenuloplanes indicus]|uniref:Glycine/D-amino acid oxidase-like deaminating enzyme n=1 Tax=Catenuloplanes indicus TaxID=137267 RepID=A0AAE3W542_9ACTN|nr:FAD-dependent oxidoreductase [Catenuloplanes indicus]MDQ0370108.1 glycine/D-amino acid oxidase-like deaminating enzyme [Catenuloplanes indicus]
MSQGGKVVIVGAGMVGAATARVLARSGADVVVVDRGPSAGGTSSGGEGNILVSDKGPGAELRLTQRSLAAWARVRAELRDELPAGFPDLEFEAKGGLVAATTEAGAAALLAFAASQRAAGVIAEVVDGDRAHELEPDLTRALTAAVYYPQDAQVQPVIATEALLAAARRHGARVLQGVEVLGPVLSGQTVTGVRTAAGTLPADAVVIAAGPWSGEVAARFGVPLPVRPRRGTVLVTARMRQRVFHKVYDADYVGAVGSGASGLMVSSVVESTAAGTVLIGSSRERRGFDDRIEARVLAALAAKALLLFPFLADVPVMRAYGGFRPFVPDHLPVIGEDPRRPGLWHATGHEGAGIGLSLATADLLHDAMLGGDPGGGAGSGDLAGTGGPGRPSGSGDDLAAAFRPDRPSLRPHLEGTTA